MEKQEKSDRQKNKEKILEQLYLSAYDLQILIPTITYRRALDYVNKVREVMEAKGKYVPEGKVKVALTSEIRKKFGF